MRLPRASLVLVALLASCASLAPRADRASARAEADTLLDGWHRSAAEADEEGYFRALAPDAVFLGTDATERWSVEEFRAYAHPHFAAGRGWTYHPRERVLAFSADGRTAWFDERLDNAKYGELRGTGVLVRTSDGWRIAHYSMSFPIPNDLTVEVVERIRATSASDGSGATRDAR